MSQPHWMKTTQKWSLLFIIIDGWLGPLKLTNLTSVNSLNTGGELTISQVLYGGTVLFCCSESVVDMRSLLTWETGCVYLTVKYIGVYQDKSNACLSHSALTCMHACLSTDSHCHSHHQDMHSSYLTIMQRWRRSGGILYRWYTLSANSRKRADSGPSDIIYY